MERGAALLLTFLLMLVLSGLALAASTFSRNSQVTVSSQLLDKQAFYIAEAGWQRARQALTAKTWVAWPAACATTYSETFGAGEYVVTPADTGSSTYKITADGYLPSQTTTAAKRELVETAISVTLSNGTNLSLAATASASSSNGGNTANKANDGSTGTKWQSNTDGAGSWLAMDYGSASMIDKIVVLERNYINELTIEWSDDASTWTIPGCLSVVESPSKTWTATFPGITHRYFRARFTDVESGHGVEVEELQSHNQGVTLGTGSVTTQW